MTREWNKLFIEAKKRLNTKEISPFITAGSYSCAIQTIDNNIYTGVTIVTTSSLSNSAETNAILNMINNGENKIKKIIILNELEELIMPCEEGIKNILELDINPEEVELLLEEKTIKLSDVLPDWWGTFRS